MELMYYKDYEIGQMETAASYRVDKEEPMEFAEKWDPQPFHVDEKAAKLSIFGGIIAPSIYTMAIGSWLINQITPKGASMGLLGFHNLQFPHPVRPGDELSLTRQLLKSQTRSDRGIIRFQGKVSKQNGVPVFTFENIVTMKRRPL